MMEARLLCLESVGPQRPDYRRDWIIANGTGIPISQAQTPQVPAPLFTADGDRKYLIEELTAMLAELPFCFAERGWSSWFLESMAEKEFLLLIKFGRQLHHIGEIEHGYCSGRVWGPMVSVIIVRSSVVQSQATGEA